MIQVELKIGIIKIALKGMQLDRYPQFKTSDKSDKCWCLKNTESGRGS